MRAKRAANQNFRDTLDTLVPLTARHWLIFLYKITLFYDSSGSKHIQAEKNKI